VRYKYKSIASQKTICGSPLWRLSTGECHLIGYLVCTNTLCSIIPSLYAAIFVSEFFYKNAPFRQLATSLQLPLLVRHWLIVALKALCPAYHTVTSLADGVSALPHLAHKWVLSRNGLERRSLLFSWLGFCRLSPSISEFSNTNTPSILRKYIHIQPEI
jgi:hypothetical protein